MMPTLVGNFEVSLDAVRKTKVPFVAAIQLNEAERPQVVRFDRVDGFNLETAVGREKDVQDIDVHGEL